MSASIFWSLLCEWIIEVNNKVKKAIFFIVNFLSKINEKTFGCRNIIHLLCHSKYFKMENEKYLKDIQDIKQMMSQSSQFLSLSGLSGIMAGIYALIGAIYADTLLPSYNRAGYEISREALTVSEQEITIKLFVTAILIVILSIITGLILSASKAKKQDETLWTPTSRKLILNFSIPLITGGIFALILLQKEYYGIIAPITLLFYGLGCVNASKNTFRDVRYLGITLIIIGLFATYFMGYGLYFWTLGFGICHIVYGTVMHFKYDKN